MGKYMNELRRLQERQRYEEQNHSYIMNRFGYLMDDYGRAFNTSHHNLKAAAIANQIAAISDKAYQEMVEEAAADVLKKVSVEVKDEASPVIRNLQKEIQNLFK